MNIKPIHEVLIGVFLFSLAGILVGPIKSELSIAQIALIRSVLVVIFMRMIYFVQVRKNPFRDLPFSFSPWQIGGAICRALNNVFFFAAIIIAGTANGYLFCNSAPIYLAFYQFFYDKRRPNIIEVLTILINFFGLSLFWFRGLDSGLFGIAMGVCGGVTFAGLIFSHTKVSKDGPAKNGLAKNGEEYKVGTVLLGNMIAVPAILILVFLPRLFLDSSSYLGSFWLSDVVWVNQFPSAKAWLLMAVLSLVQSAIPELLWARSMNKVNKENILLASFAPTLVAVLAPTWTALLLGERFLDATTIVGALLVHLAVVVLFYYQKKSQIKK